MRKHNIQKTIIQHKSYVSLLQTLMSKVPAILCGTLGTKQYEWMMTMRGEKKVKGWERHDSGRGRFASHRRAGSYKGALSLNHLIAF